MKARINELFNEVDKTFTDIPNEVQDVFADEIIKLISKFEKVIYKLIELENKRDSLTHLNREIKLEDELTIIRDTLLEYKNLLTNK